MTSTYPIQIGPLSSAFFYKLPKESVPENQLMCIILILIPVSG